jgi:hypothetical protein
MEHTNSIWWGVNRNYEAPNNANPSIPLSRPLQIFPSAPRSEKPSVCVLPSGWQTKLHTHTTGNIVDLQLRYEVGWTKRQQALPELEAVWEASLKWVRNPKSPNLQSSTSTRGKKCRRESCLYVNRHNLDSPYWGLSQVPTAISRLWIGARRNTQHSTRV